MWAGVQSWLRGSLFEVNSIMNLVILSVLFIILLALLSVGMVIFHSRSTNIYFGLIVGIAYSLLFKISNLNLVGLFILMLLFYHAEDIVMGEMRERLKMSSRFLIRKGLVNFIAAFFVLASFAAFQSPAIEDFKNIKKLPSSSETFVQNIVEQTMGPRIEGATPEQKQSVLNQVSRETIQELNTFLKPYFQYAPPALAFGLFLVLWGFGWIFIWLGTGLGMLIFWILKKTGFFKIEERDVKAETIVV